MKHFYHHGSNLRTLLVPILLVGSIVAALGVLSTQGPNQDRLATSVADEPSGGFHPLRRSTEGVVLGPHSGREADHVRTDRTVDVVFDGPNFDDNSDETGGWVFIPPDPNGAAGPNILVGVVNVMIEARSKTGVLVWRDALQDFFAPLAPANFTFDPKVIYDHYEDRFVVVTLEQVAEGVNPHAGNTSRILLAVSTTATPTTPAHWHYHAIDAKEVINGWDHWLDYPGFEVDEEAIYVLGRMFAHSGGTSSREVRMWIVDKGVAGGFYGGGPAAVTKHDPYAAVDLTDYGDRTTMPAQVYGAGGVGPGIGTFLTRYDGITVGGPGQPESLLVIRVDDPIGAVAFTAAFVDVGDIEDVGGEFGWPPVPDAPQLGTDDRIDVNDRRILDAVWRNNELWLTMTIMPNSGPDTGEPTAHWMKIDTTTWPPVLADQGDIGGEDIHLDGGVYTFFPSLAVNDAGDAVFGFAASSPSMYCGAYVTGREAGDPSGTVRRVETIRAGLDYYIRRFGSTRNRWGDYSGAALDPADEDVFWVFNEYAMARGTIIDDEDGRWGTAWGSYSFGPIVTANVPTPAAPPHDVRKNRYVSIDPNNDEPVGLKVELVSMRRCSGLLSRACKVDDDCEAAVPGSGTCIQHPDVSTAGPWWVQAPQQEQLGCLPGPCGDEDWFTRVDATPYFDLWTLGTLHIGDCEIIPVASYEIRACLPPDGTVCTDPLTIGTIAQPFVSPGFRGNFGDVAGGVVGTAFTPPDGFTNVVDVSAYTLTKQNYGTINTPQTHPTWVDLHGPGDGNPPQYIVNVSDVGQILKAFAGDAWTDDPGNMNPGECP